MPTLHETDPLSDGLQGSLNSAWDDRPRLKLRVDESRPSHPARAASPPPGVRKSVRQPVRVRDEVTLHVTTMAGARLIETEPGATVLIEPNFTTASQDPSEIILEAPWGDVRVISMVAARHRIQINGALVEFEPVRGANLTLRDGLIIGTFRASLAGSNPPEIEKPNGKQAGVKKKIIDLFGG